MRNTSLSKFTIVLMFISLPFFIPFKSEASSKDPQCFNEELPITDEEMRINDPENNIPQRILEDSGFDVYVDEFREALCEMTNVEDAKEMINKKGEELWENAVNRAQNLDTEGLDRYDDRPLYWTRQNMSVFIRQWDPEFGLSDHEREVLLKELEYSSRGIKSINFSEDKNVKRILVSGFDPYQLQNEVRRSNPSGASALQLDGLEIETKDGPARIEAVSLPVRWRDFDEGIVEDVFAPYLERGSNKRADLIMTISQGGPRQMAIEGFAGRWQTGVDNEMASRSGVIPTVEHWPMPEELPEFIETTLPYEEMIEANTGPWEVFRNDRICEMIGTKQVCHTDGPTEGAEARSGGGGAYLSNESQYRSNRVRLGLGAVDMPGGHLHIASLEFYPKNKSIYIDEDFRHHRQVTVDQTVELVKAAANAGKVKTSARMIDVIDKYEGNGEIDSTAARLLRTHLISLDHYEKQEKADKVVKHAEGLKALLDHYFEDGKLSNDQHELLIAISENIIEMWK